MTATVSHTATPRENQVIALAALYQALSEVRSIAADGQHNAAAVRVCLQGLLADADSDLTQVYGPVAGLQTGLQRIQTQLGERPDAELTNHVLVLVHLERKAMKRQAVLARLGEGLERARRQRDYFNGINQTVAASLADVYANTISTLQPRIVVRGRREWLEDADRAALIRSLLLSCVRAVTFWKQAGGRRLHLLFSRRQLRDTASALATID